MIKQSAAVFALLLLGTAPAIAGKDGIPSGAEVAAQEMAKAQAEKARNDAIVAKQREAEAKAKAAANTAKPSPTPAPTSTPVKK